MKDTAPHSGLRLMIDYVGLALPAVGLAVLLVAWLLPQLHVPRALGIVVLIVGWLFWSILFASAGDEVAPAGRLRKFALGLLFFPVLYPLHVALAPYVERLRRDMLRPSAESADSDA